MNWPGLKNSFTGFYWCFSFALYTTKGPKEFECDNCAENELISGNLEGPIPFIWNWYSSDDFFVKDSIHSSDPSTWHYTLTSSTASTACYEVTMSLVLSQAHVIQSNDSKLGWDVYILYISVMNSSSHLCRISEIISRQPIFNPDKTSKQIS